MLKNYAYLLLGALLMPTIAISQEREEHDNPAERAAWERSIVKDPQTGLVPRGELENARTEMLDWFKDVKQLRRAAAIPNVNWKERGPNNIGGRTRALMWDPKNGTTKKKVWAGGVSGGLWYNDDISNAESSWIKVNDLWDNLAVSWITHHPVHPDTMYVATGERNQGFGESNTGSSGSAGGGIWRSINGGQTWERLTSTIPDYVTNSTQAGWREVFKIIVLKNGDILAVNLWGLVRSKDKGQTWQYLNSLTNGPTFAYHGVSDMELGTDGILYVAEGTQNVVPRIIKSTDDQITAFVECTLPTPLQGGAHQNGARIEIALAPSTQGATQVIYAVHAAWSTPVTRFFSKSTDGGATWAPITIPTYPDDGKTVPFFNGQAFYDLILGTHPTNPNALFAGGVGWNITANINNTDGGWIKNITQLGWFPTHEIIHADHHAFMANPNNPNEAIFGHDGGVSYAPNWTNLTIPDGDGTLNALKNQIFTRNKNYNVTQYFAADLHPAANNGLIAGGTQDNGTHSINSAPNTVGAGTQINGGDGALTFIDQVTPHIVISSYTNIVPKIHTNGGVSEDGVNLLSFSKKGKFINPADYDSRAHTYYANYTYDGQKAAEDTLLVRYKFVNSGNGSSIHAIKNADAPKISVSFVKLGKTTDSTSNRVLYLGTTNGLVYKTSPFSIDGTQTVTLTKIMDTTSTNKGNVSCIDFGADENTIIVTKSNYNIQSVFWTTNGGTNWASKDETGHGLPNVPIRYALINPKNTKQVLLATELGVWSTTDITAANPAWEPTNQALANVRCDMLKYRESDATVLVATHGRGMFTTQLPSVVTAAPTGATAQNFCPGATVNNLGATGTAIKWYDAATGGNLLAATTALVNGTIYYASQTVSGTESTQRLPVTATIVGKGLAVTLINVGQSKSATKIGQNLTLNSWVDNFITPDGGPSLENSTQANPTLFFSENVNKTAPRYWTVYVDGCAFGTNGSVSFDILATPEVGAAQSYNSHENNAPYFSYANRDGFTELYAQNNPAFGFFLDNGTGGNIYDAGLPKGLYKVSVRYWEQKGWGSLFPATRKSQGPVQTYQEYWFRIQSKDGVGVGAAKTSPNSGLIANDYTDMAEAIPNPFNSVLHLFVNDAKDKKVDVSLTDASGRMILQSGFVPETNRHQEDINVGDIANGIYFLKVNADGKQSTLKVMKVQ
jgi:hypothetical protein